MTTRKMTAKGFLHKSRGKIAPLEFLNQHREWLSQDGLGEVTGEVLIKLDQGDIFPTEALKQIQDIVLGWHLAEEISKAEAAIEKADAPRATNKKFKASIYNEEGQLQSRININGEEVILVEAFEFGKDAEGWADRRLFECASDCFAVIESLTMVDSAGLPMATVIMRQDALSRILKKSKQPFAKVMGKTSGKLSWGMKVKGSFFHASRG